MSRSTARRTRSVRVRCAHSSVGLARAPRSAPIPAAIAGTPPGIPGGLAAQQPERDHHRPVVGARAGRDPVRRAGRRHQSGFSGSPDVSISTVSNSYVPTMNLKAGTQYWRVQAYNATGDPLRLGRTRRSPRRRCRCRSSSAGRRPTSLQQPDNPPLLTWNPSPGAISYKVEVDGDGDFVGSTTVRDEEHLARRPRPARERATGSGASSRRRATASSRAPSAARSFVISAARGAR